MWSGEERSSSFKKLFLSLGSAGSLTLPGKEVSPRPSRSLPFPQKIISGYKLWSKAGFIWSSEEGERNKVGEESDKLKRKLGFLLSGSTPVHTIMLSMKVSQEGRCRSHVVGHLYPCIQATCLWTTHAQAAHVCAPFVPSGLYRVFIKLSHMVPPGPFYLGKSPLQGEELGSSRSLT